MMAEIDLETLGGDRYWKYMVMAWLALGFVLITLHFAGY
jgi:hypothetical protein